MSSNIELCNDGKCVRVRMGEVRHQKHIFMNDYLKRLQRFWKLVTIVALLLISVIVLIHNPSFGLELKDRWIITIAVFSIIVSFLVSMGSHHFQSKQLQTSSLFKVFELLSSPDIRKARKRIHDAYNSLKGKPPVIFTDTEYENDADVVLSSFDQVSATVLNGLLDRDLFFDTYGEMVVRDWNTLKDEIKLRQSKNRKTLRHFTMLKIEFEEILRKDPKHDESQVEPY